MEQGRLDILKADIDRQIEVIEQIYEKVRRRSEGYETNEERMESLAYQFHNLYCAFEDLMKIVADEFENRISERTNWHIRFLSRMNEEIPGIRPALFSRESFLLLDELRAFRHWFRHSYSHEIDPKKLGIVVEKAAGLSGMYRADVQRFIQQLSEADEG